MTSDLLIHTIELNEQTNENNSGAHQIRILSTLDCKNEMPLSELPKLKQLMMSGKMKCGDGTDVLVILFETTSYITVCFGIDDKNASYPVVESFTKSELEIDEMTTLVEVVCSPNHLFRIVQN